MWNGRICKNPASNVYCRGNYSLLSSRIQRRINLEVEEKHRGESLCKLSETYVPPCFWCINAFGENECSIKDPHPFSDLEWLKDKFKVVPPLNVDIIKYSLFTWCFSLSFAEEGSPEGRYPADLKERIEKFLLKIKPNESLVFFYLNFSNPITGDENKRLLLGAAVIKDVTPPQKYKIPHKILSDLRRGRGMQNFPENAWFFRLQLEPETAFILPYHHYLKWIDEAEADEEKDNRTKKLKEVAISIDDPTLYPHFKYVCMHLSTDQAIYLLYLMRKSLKKMREHKVVSMNLLEETSSKIDNLLKFLWTKRGKYPGFKAAVSIILKGRFGEKSGEIAEEIYATIKNEVGDLSNYFENEGSIITTNNTKMRSALLLLEKQKEKIEFLSRFDFSPLQMKRIFQIISTKGFNTIRINPYLLLEEYGFDQVEHWDSNESDSGIDIYHLDIVFFPDLNYADWFYEEFNDPKSSKRMRAVISKILLNAALNEGNTYLSRNQILQQIQEYPLYYIGEKLQLGESEIELLEKDPIFKEKFIIERDPIHEEVIYQLKTLRKIEEKIERTVKVLLQAPLYDLSPDDEQFISSTAQKDLSGITVKIDKEKTRKEREEVYHKALENRFLVISGKAGTGKTQAIINLVNYLRKKVKGRIFVLTPTGKSNLVIQNRLHNLNINIRKSNIDVYTIHRFLYRGIIEAIQKARLPLSLYYGQVSTLRNLIDNFLSGKINVYPDLERVSENCKFNPSVIIIDEASMVDELTFAALLALINLNSVMHFIVVGDENQLPPIGVGRPFSDILFFLRKEGYERNITKLHTNLRFPPESSVSALSEIYASEDAPILDEIEKVISSNDETLEVRFFKDIDDLKLVLKEIISEIWKKELNLTIDNSKSLFHLFRDLFNEKEVDIFQILTPRRVGEFGSWSINYRAVMGDETTILAGSKLICEENLYLNVIDEMGRKQRVLGLANGSMIYYGNDRRFYSSDITDFFDNFGRKAGLNLIRKIRENIDNPLTIEKIIDFAYAITIHKSQGSDFDYVILVLKDFTSFVCKELFYTAITRAKKKLYLLIHEHLSSELPVILWQVYNNSVNKNLRTKLFTPKKSPFKPYIMSLRNGKKIELKSKIEYIIAKALDDLGVEFKYEPKDFEDHRIYPDFRININGRTYYWEHLGLLEERRYRERWLRKLEKYNSLGIIDNLITTSESKEPTDVESKVKTIVQHLLQGTLSIIESGYPSKHHYEI